MILSYSQLKDIQPVYYPPELASGYQQNIKKKEKKASGVEDCQLCNPLCFSVKNEEGRPPAGKK